MILSVNGKKEDILWRIIRSIDNIHDNIPQRIAISVLVFIINRLYCQIHHNYDVQNIISTFV